MKILISIYVVIGLIISPLLYSNHAYEYRVGGKKLNIMTAMVQSAIYWPSYLFSIEPEVDGESYESFDESIFKMVEWRDSKLFSGMRTLETTAMVASAVDSCAKIDGASGWARLAEIKSSGNKNDPDIKRFQEGLSKLMKRMDGHDFLDVIKEGEKCNKELLEKSTKNPNEFTVADPVINMVTIPMINGECGDVDNLIKSLKLNPKRIDIHGPDDEDSESIGCAYRQNPKAGTLVPEGSIVEYRSWYEKEEEEEEEEEEEKAIPVVQMEEITATKKFIVIAPESSQRLLSEMLQQAHSSFKIAEIKGEIEAIKKPEVGSRKNARKLNDEGLLALKSDDFLLSINKFENATIADPADIEILNNYIYALIKSQNIQLAEEKSGILLTMSPGRSSAWANLAEIYAMKNKKEEAVAALILVFQFSSNKDRTITFLNERSIDNESSLKEAAKMALEIIKKM